MSGLIDPDYVQYALNPYSGELIGTVIDNKDPDKHHRLKIKIPGIHEYEDVKHYPWCVPAQVGLAGGGETEQNIPRIGSKVYVVFQNGDQHFPMYKGGVKDKDTLKGVLDENYPNRKGFDLGDGHSMYTDKETNETRYDHPSGAVVHVAPNGDINIVSPGHVSIKASTLSLDISGGTTISTSTLTVNGLSQFNGNMGVNGAMINNGTNIGSTHTHGGVDRGSQRTDGPS